ncbi:hypothetical protein ACHAWO_002832 [Cyclotella atomus]|uniref:Uncharacterized protein n=1 Tax=Cyclotella atomus TaxID=382360 RepID=A0ABD3NU55_9STRA
MPPTTVIAYQKRNHHDDTLSISTNSIQKCQPTSYCDDIANQFYITCLRPLADLLPHAIEDRERRIAEYALERSRVAVIDGVDLNVVSAWERQVRRRKRMEKKMKEQRLVQMQQSRVITNNVNASNVDEASACSESSDSFVIREKPKNNKLTGGIMLRKVQPRLKPIPGNVTCKTDSDSFVISGKPKRSAAAAATMPKFHATNDSNAALTSLAVVVSNRPTVEYHRLKPSLAIKKVMLLTAHQHIALNKTLQPISTMKRVMKAPSKLSVNKKGFHVKSKLFRRKKKSSGDSIADDITLSSSNQSSCDGRELVVTEVSPRKFGSSGEQQCKEIGLQSMTTDFERASSEQGCVSPGMDSVTDKSTSEAPDPCIMVENQSMPIVAAARKTYSTVSMKKRPSTHFSIRDSPRRTVYDEREVDNFVSRLIAPPVKECISSKKEVDLDDADAGVSLDRAKRDEREVENCVSRLVAPPNKHPCSNKTEDADDAVSLDMQALMHSISRKYSVSREVNLKCRNEEDDDSELTDEKTIKRELFPDNTFNKARFAPADNCSSHGSEASLPSVISVTRRAARSLENSPKREAAASRSKAKTPSSTTDIAAGSNKSGNSAKVTTNPSNDSSSFDSTEQPLQISYSTIDSVKSNKLNRLRMVRSAYMNSSVDTSGSSTNEHDDRQTPAQASVEHKPCLEKYSQHRRVTWAENLASITTYAVEQDRKEERDQLVNCNGSTDRHENVAKSRTTGATKSSSCPDRRFADAGKLNRMRMARVIRVNSISAFGTDQPDDESPVCTGNKGINHSETGAELESSETTNEEPKPTDIPDDYEIKSKEPVQSKRRQMNRRARLLHQQRVQSIHSKAEPAPFTAKGPQKNVTITNDHKEDSIDSNHAGHVQMKPRNLLVEAKRVQSFQSKTCAARS